MLRKTYPLGRLYLIEFGFDFMTEITFIPDSQIPEASEGKVREFEQLLGARLPDDYRNYLLRHNGEMPCKTDYWMPGEKNWIESVAEMYALIPADPPQSLNQFIIEDYGVPSGWLPIANSGYGDFPVISLLEEDQGAIYYLFHEEHGYDPTERDRGVYRLASNFNVWINSLQELSKNGQS